MYPLLAHDDAKEEVAVGAAASRPTVAAAAVPAYTARQQQTVLTLQQAAATPLTHSPPAALTSPTATSYTSTSSGSGSSSRPASASASSSPYSSHVWPSPVAAAGTAAPSSVALFNGSFARSSSAPTSSPSTPPPPSTPSSSSTSPVLASSSKPPLARASTISPSLMSRDVEAAGWSRRSSTPHSSHSTPSSPPATSAVQRLLSIRSAYLTETGLLSVNADFASSPLSASSLSLASQLPSASTPLSPASRLPRSLRLAFSSPQLESAYQSDYFARYFQPLRRVVLACVAIWCLFVINDVYQYKDGDEGSNRKHFDVTVGLRFGVAAVVASTSLASYHPTVKAAIGPRVLRWCVAFYIVLFGTCQVAFGVIEENTQEPTYCDFIILLAAMSASLFRLPFFLSTACNVLLFVTFVVMTVSSEAWQVGGVNTFFAAMVWLAVALLLFTVNGYLVERSMRSTFFAAQQLAAEEANSQRVLATMLPVRVIAELRGAKSPFVYEYHRSVSVLFSHIHHFDQHTATLEATAVVELLNDLFSRFDHLTDMFGVYKVETIGDVYLVSGGVPDALEPHASICCLLALAMMEETSRLLASRQLQLRIGVHSGDVIAGVVGMKYPRYRLMGDTVNTASRMSTTCEANQIQISRQTFSLLAPDFICLYHGQRAVKGKGPMDTYLLKEACLPASVPASRRSSLRFALDDDGKEPMYHSVPQPGQLYCNVTLSPHITIVRADDPAAILRDRDAGRTVHRLRRAPVEDVREEKREPQQQPGDEQKEGNRSQGFIARTSPAIDFDRLSPSRSHDPSPRPPPAIRIPSPLSQSQSLSPSPSQQSTSSTTPGSPMSVSPPNGEYVDVAGEPLPSPSTTYTLSAERVRETFLSQHSHSAAFLQHFHWSSVDVSHTAASAASVWSLLLSRLAHPLSSVHELLRVLLSAFRPAFEGDGFLAFEFQSHWARRTVAVSRLGFTVFVVGLLLLGAQEMAAEELGGADQRLYHHNPPLWQTWLLRAPAILLGLTVLLLSQCYESAFCQWQQPIVAVSWTVMTILTIGVSMLRQDNTTLYGVSVTIILVTTSSFFVGLQFRWVSFTTLPILLFYFVGALTIEGSAKLNSFFLLAAVILSMMSAHAAEHFARLDFIRHRTLNEEEAKTRYILDNMLPKSVMDQLVRQHLTGHHSIIAHQCERAAVLFCDIVQFTAMAAVIRAEDVVAILNVLFSAFDALTTLHSVYKVETIGDAYLACSGVVHASDSSIDLSHAAHNHVQSLVACALDFLAASQHCRTPDDKPLQVRIGIHTGTVVAGVIGRKMPRYHLFGESVTIAEEIEQSGLAGRVVISGPTHDLCHHSFVCRPMKPLTRSATLAVIPRFEVVGPVSGRRRVELSVSAPQAERVDLELSALPQVVLDILHKVRVGEADEATAAAVAVDGREQQHTEPAARYTQHTGHRRAVSDAILRPGKIQMDGHLTPLLSSAG